MLFVKLTNRRNVLLVGQVLYDENVLALYFGAIQQLSE